MRKLYITVKNQFDDIHCYPNAPDEVYFLKNLHRHTFVIETTIEVFHEDRELEFYMVKDYIDTLTNEIKQLQVSKSCENICTMILDKLKEKYGTTRKYIVSCSEDGWNKATVEEE